MKIKEYLVENIDFIKNEYEIYIKEQAYNEYLHSKRAQKIMYECGDLEKDFNKYYTKEIRNIIETDMIIESDIVHLVVEKLKNTENKLVLENIFSIIGELANDNEEDDTTLYLYFIEVLFQNKQDVDKYFRYLNFKLMEELRACFEGWGPEEMVNYIDDLIVKKKILIKTTKN